MAISLASLKSTTALKPPRMLIHGVHGVGKTTYAAGAPDPVFILTEDGLGTLDVPHFPLARSLGRTDLMTWSPDEFAALIEVIVTAFTDRLRELGEDDGEVPYP